MTERTPDFRDVAEVGPAPARWVRHGLTILLLLYLLFAHPCHGDEDTELIRRFWING